MNSIVARIREVWGGEDDFSKGGLPYVGFLIRQDVEDMEEDKWEEEGSVEELADVCINAMRMMDERGYDPEEAILDRLDNHEEKGTGYLVERYRGIYDDEHSSDGP